MPATALKLPEAPAARAFRALVELLRSDPELSRVVRTWMQPESLTLTPQQLPAVRLVPSVASQERKTLGRPGPIESIVEVAVETAVPGTDWADSAALWAAISCRVFHPDPAQRAANDAFLRAGKVMEVIDVTPATAINDTGELFAVASGRLRLRIWHD